MAPLLEPQYNRTRPKRQIYDSDSTPITVESNPKELKRNSDPGHSTSLLALFQTNRPMMFREVVEAGGDQFAEVREELLSGALSTQSEGPAANTLSGWSTGLRWWGRFCEAIGLPEVLDFPVGTVAGRHQVINLTLMFVEFVAQNSKGKGPMGAALPSTSTRYLIPVRAIHRDLGVDLAFTAPMVKVWELGRAKALRRTDGLRVVAKKVGVTKAMMKDMWAEDWSGVGNSHMVQIAQTALQFNFQMLYRRSELLLKTGTFDHNLHLTRDHLKYYDVNWQRVFPSVENLEQLRQRGGFMLSYSPVLKNDSTGSIWGNSPTPFRIRPAGSPFRFIDCIPYILALEILDPIPDAERRKRTPLFVDTATGTTLRVAKFDQVFIDVLRASYLRKGIIKSEAETRKIYSLHSIRIGGLNAYKKADAPVHVRKAFGRWTSRAVFGYDRDDWEELAGYVEAQDIDVDLLQAMDPDMPTWPQSKDAVTGDLIVPPGSEVEDSSLVEEARGYLVSVRRRGTLDGPGKASGI